MTSSEARRCHLYNSLRDLIGPIRRIHSFPDLANAEDIATLRSDIEARFERVEDRFERVEDRFVALGERLDRIVLSLVAGLVAIIAAFIAQSLF